jgi:hypothetical protein
MLEAGVYVTPLRKAGVSLETLNQGLIDWDDFGGRVIYGIAQEGKHQYVRDLSINVLRGLQTKAVQCNGYPGGPAPFGYRRVTMIERRDGEHDGDRRRDSRVSRLEIVPEEAEIVRRIFAEYLKPSASANSIATMLEAEGVATPRRSSFWRRTVVADMLTTVAYTGVVQWGASALGKYSARTPDGGVVSRKGIRTAAKPVGAIRHFRPDICPPIIDKATFDKAQELLRARRRATRRPGSARPLSGLVVCGACGKRMHADGGGSGTQPCYRCASSAIQGAGKPCPSRRVPEAILLDAITAKLDEAFGNTRGMAELTKRIARLVKEQAPKAPKADHAAALRRRLAGLERQLADGAARLTIVPAGIVAELAQALDKLRQERDTVARELASLAAEATAAKAAPKDVVSEIVGEYRTLRKSLSGGNFGHINAGLSRMGAAITIDSREGDLFATVGLVTLPETCHRLQSFEVIQRSSRRQWPAAIARRIPSPASRSLP